MSVFAYLLAPVTNLKMESTILESPDRSKLHSENKYFKSCLLVVLLTDLIKHEFRLFTNRHHDVVISATFCPFIAIKSQQNLFILGSHGCSKPD